MAHPHSDAPLTRTVPHYGSPSLYQPDQGETKGAEQHTKNLTYFKVDGKE